jgi:hypothetical protein
MTRPFALLAAALAVPFLLAACGDDDDGGDGTLAPTATIIETDVCGENPDPGLPTSVQVTEPSPQAQVQSPLSVRGQIAAFEATFQLTIKDADGNDIADRSAMSQEGQVLSPFDAVIEFEVDEPTPACLWVYEESASDGSPTKVVQLPVILIP